MESVKRIEYFSDVPRIGCLYLDEVLFMYDDEPMAFTCKDKDDNIYFCICDDNIDEYSWLITKVSEETVDDLISNRITDMAPFKEAKDEVLIINKKFGEVECSCEWCRFEDIDRSELPAKEQYLFVNDGEQMEEDEEDYVGASILGLLRIMQDMLDVSDEEVDEIMKEEEEKIKREQAI